MSADARRQGLHSLGLLLAAVALFDTHDRVRAFSSAGLLLASWFVFGRTIEALRARKVGPERARSGFRKFTYGTVCVIGGIVAAFTVRAGPAPGTFVKSEGWKPGEAAVTHHPTLGWGVMGDPHYVGQRLDRDDPTRPDKILLIGDSIFFAHGLEKRESAAALIDGRLKRHQLLNASVSGYSIEQYALLADELVPRFKPKLVVIGLFAGNDYQVTMREFMWGHSKPLLEVKDGRLVPANRASACIDRLSQSVGMRFVHLNQGASFTLTTLVCGPRFLTHEEGEATIRAALDEIRRVTEANGGQVLFLNSLCEPEIKMNRLSIRYLSKLPHLQRLERDAGLSTLDLYPPLDLVPNMFQPDRCHYNGRGQLWVADTLQRAFAERYGIEPEQLAKP